MAGVVSEVGFPGQGDPFCFSSHPQGWQQFRRLLFQKQLGNSTQSESTISLTSSLQLVEGFYWFGLYQFGRK